MDTKVQIVASFHRFASQGDGKPERKETFAAGQTATVPEADAADWIAKGLAKPVDAPAARRSGRPDAEIAQA